MTSQPWAQPAGLPPSLVNLSEQQAQALGDTVMMTYAGRDFSYREVHHRALGVAEFLLAHEVKAGDRVAYLGPNHPALVETLLACLRIGAIFIPLNWRLAAPELDYQLGDSQATLLLVSADMSQRASQLTTAVTVQQVRWQPEPVAGQPAPVLAAELSGDAPALLLYTSGTTGHPKGAVLTHSNIIWNTFNLLLETDLTGQDRTLIAAPLFHVAALNQQLLASVIRGASFVLEAKWNTEVVFDAIVDKRLTWLFGVTTMFADLVNSPRWETTDLSSLRFVNSGGAPIPVPLISQFLDRQVMFCQGYGLTETAPNATFLRAADALTKPGSAGLPVTFTDIRVISPLGEDCAAGVCGEILVRGPNVMSGYWNNPVATAQAFSPGRWFHTGDIGYTDDDGYLFIVDRLKDMYISGGENVYPAEVESVLFEHPEVAEVAVVSAPDDRWGEVGRAFVVPTGTSQPQTHDLQEFVATRLAKYKVPKDFVIVDALPKTGSGKVHKVALRDTSNDPSPDVAKDAR